MSRTIAAPNTGPNIMNRRGFIKTASALLVSTSIAGCTLPGETDDSAAATEIVVRDAPGGGDQNVGDAVTETSSPNLALSNITFQRAGQKGIVVAGDLKNASDRDYERVVVEVKLYDENETEDSLLDSAQEQESRESLASGTWWQWATTFRDEPIPNIDYYSVTARGYYE